MRTYWFTVAEGDKYLAQPEYSWIVKKLGKNRQAGIFHRAGIYDENNVRFWQEIKEELMMDGAVIKNDEFL